MRRKAFNAEGQYVIPIRLPRDRMATLSVPLDFNEADAERLTKWIALIAEGGMENVRPVGPEEPA